MRIWTQRDQLEREMLAEQQKKLEEAAGAVSIHHQMLEQPIPKFSDQFQY